MTGQRIRDLGQLKANSKKHSNHFTHLVLETPRVATSESPLEPVCGTWRTVLEGDRDWPFLAAVWRARAC